jgi:hypothetical protein
MGAGKTTVDLTGDYTKGFNANIQGGVGEATVMLPSEVGVKAKVEGGLRARSTPRDSRGLETRTSTTPTGNRILR